MRSSQGGAQATFAAPRAISEADIALPRGYQIEQVASGLSFPTAVTFDDDGAVYVIEAGYSYGEVWTTPRLLRIDPGGAKHQVAAGENNGPWTGATFADGAFYIAEGGTLLGGRILRVTLDGRITPIVQGLPTYGDHHTNGPAIGPDGMVYFATGTATNSGVVGPDNAQFGWLKRKRDFHDVACGDLELTGHNFTSRDPLGDGAAATTGAFVPFGQRTEAGQRIRGQVPCSGALLRVAPNGGEPQLVGWGFRNPFGLAFAPDGQLYVTENGYDDRGSRPVWGTPDVLWRVRTSAGSVAWYGWPDYSAGRLLSNSDFRPPGKAVPQRLLARDPSTPPQPAAILGVHSSSNGMDFSHNKRFGYVGEAFIAQFGDQAPTVGKVLAPVGFKIVRVDVTSGVVHDFAVNRGTQNGPASKIGGGGLERPIDVEFDRSGESLYVVDFGVLLETGEKTLPQPNTGVLWRITRR